jgi:hypothetical protein
MTRRETHALYYRSYWFDQTQGSSGGKVLAGCPRIPSPRWPPDRWHSAPTLDPIGRRLRNGYLVRGASPHGVDVACSFCRIIHVNAVGCHAPRHRKERLLTTDDPEFPTITMSAGQHAAVVRGALGPVAPRHRHDAITRRRTDVDPCARVIRFEKPRRRFGGHLASSACRAASQQRHLLRVD